MKLNEYIAQLIEYAIRTQRRRIFAFLVGMILGER